MKKLVFMFALMFSVMFTSCGSSASKTEQIDSTGVDTTLVDTLQVDSVDSLQV